MMIAILVVLFPVTLLFGVIGLARLETLLPPTEEPAPAEPRPQAQVISLLPRLAERSHREEQYLDTA